MLAQNLIRNNFIHLYFSLSLSVAQNLQNIIQEQIAQNLGATTSSTAKVKSREEVTSGDRAAGPTPPPRPSQLQQPHQQQQQQHPALMILATALMQAQTGEEASILQNPQVVGFLQDVVMQAESERSVSELLSNPALGPLFGASPAVLPPATATATTAAATTTTSTRWGPVEATAKDDDAAAATKRPALLGQAPPPGPQNRTVAASAPLTVNTSAVATSLSSSAAAVPPAKDSSPTPPIVKNNLNNLLNTQNLNQLLGSLTNPQQLSTVTGAATSHAPPVPAAISVSTSSSVPGGSVIPPAPRQPDPNAHLFNPSGPRPLLDARRAGQRPVLLGDPPSLPHPPQQPTGNQVPHFPRPATATAVTQHAQVGQGLNQPGAAAAMMLSSPVSRPPAQSQGTGAVGAQQAMAMAAAAAAAATNNPYQQQQQQHLHLQQQLQQQQQQASSMAMAGNPFFQQLQQSIPGLGITGPPPSQAFLFGAPPQHNPLLSAQMMAPQSAAAAAAAAAAASAAPAGAALQQQYASYLMGAGNPYLAAAAMSPPAPPVGSNPQLAVGAQLAAAMSTPPMAGMKRKLTIPPSPEQSPDGPYIGQHSQGLGGHYADSYWRKKAKYN